MGRAETTPVAPTGEGRLTPRRRWPETRQSAQRTRQLQRAPPHRPLKVGMILVTRAGADAGLTFLIPQARRPPPRPDGSPTSGRRSCGHSSSPALIRSAAEKISVFRSRNQCMGAGRGDGRACSGGAPRLFAPVGGPSLRSRRLTGPRPSPSRSRSAAGTRRPRGSAPDRWGSSSTTMGCRPDVLSTVREDPPRPPWTVAVLGPRRPDRARFVDPARGRRFPAAWRWLLTTSRWSPTATRSSIRAGHAC